MSKTEWVEYKVPKRWLSAIFNADDSGLEGPDLKLCHAFIDEIGSSMVNVIDQDYGFCLCPHSRLWDDLCLIEVLTEAQP